MSLTDPISDMLTIIRNANRIKKEQADVRRSKMNASILEVLKKERFIYDFKTIEDETPQGLLRIYLKQPVGLEGGRRIRRITRIERVSKPGLRVYTGASEMPRVLNGIGSCVVSTSKGMMTGDEARRARIGGEVIMKIW